MTARPKNFAASEPGRRAHSPAAALAEWLPVTSAAQLFSLAENRPRLCVFLTAPSCYICKLVAPKLDHFPIDAEFAGVAFAKADVEEVEVRGGGAAAAVADALAPGALTPAPRAQGLGEVLEVRALPTFVLLRDGAEVCRLEGAPQRRPARALAQALRAHLGEAAPSDGR